MILRGLTDYLCNDILNSSNEIAEIFFKDSVGYTIIFMFLENETTTSKDPSLDSRTKTYIKETIEYVRRNI